MKTNVNLWWILAAFFLLVTKSSHRLEHHRALRSSVVPRDQWVGTSALLFTVFMSVMIAFYVDRVHRAQAVGCPRTS